jgi:hypothetical protein
MTLAGQPGGDGLVIKTLARQVKEPGLHLSAAVIFTRSGGHRCWLMPPKQ